MPYKLWLKIITIYPATNLAAGQLYKSTIMDKKLQIQVIESLVSFWHSEGIPNSDRKLYNEVLQFCNENEIVIEEFNDKNQQPYKFN